MSYQALYRKWRPGSFDEVVGQDAVVTTLKNQIKSDRIGHAYLFCGTRGTGKTSAAKIFARAVNCPNAAEHDGSPCNECEVCKAISSGRAMNVFEIDAASNNGVDNIRDIRDQVEYPPVTGRYKVYIIDEVHMLSTGAFNALLKTLEEPPSYVIFILATTDPQKIPATVLSRCQRYDFRRMGKANISGHLKDITEREGVSVEDKALQYIAEAADGSMRDSLSLLDQCLAYHYGEVLSYEHVLDILGTADSAVFSALFRQILQADIEGALAGIADLVNTGREVSQLILDFISYLRNVLLAKSTGNKAGLDISGERLEMAEADAALCDRDRLIGIITALAELSNRIRFSSQKRIQLEVEIIRLCVPQAAQVIPTAVQQPIFTAAPRPQVQAVPASAMTGTNANAFAASQQPQAAAPVSAKIHVDIAEKSRDIGAETDSIAISEAQYAAAAGRTLEAAAQREPVSAVNPEPAAQTIQSKASNPATGSLLDLVRQNWNLLTGELSASNRPLFSGVLLTEERGSIVLVFKNKMNYTLAARNAEENGVIKLRELAMEKLGVKVAFMARIAKPGEIEVQEVKATNEELARINFPISIED